MEIKINNELYEIEAAPEEMLLWVLRDDLGLSGTRAGCAAGYCGACTVHVDGEVRRACITPLSAVEGRSIRTIEGLAEGDRLHPMQQAFIDEQVPQCGWCMSGQIMQAVAFLETKPAASEEEIWQAMSANYCRCGCYVRIKRAVLKAAEEMRA